MSFSGKMAAGGKLFRGLVTAPATAAMEGQSLGLGMLPLKPGGRGVRPLSRIICPSGGPTDSLKAHSALTDMLDRFVDLCKGTPGDRPAGWSRTCRRTRNLRDSSLHATSSACDRESVVV